MIIVLNGPLGIGKSTLAEALTESIDNCVLFEGDRLVAANPPPLDELNYLHPTIALLVVHHRQFGYRHFVIDHIWRSAAVKRRNASPHRLTQFYTVLSGTCSGNPP